MPVLESLYAAQLERAADAVEEGVVVVGIDEVGAVLQGRHSLGQSEDVRVVVPHAAFEEVVPPMLKSGRREKMQG